ATVPAPPDDTPADLASLARAALDADPARRPQSPEAFRVELAAHVTVVGLFDGADASMKRANDAMAKDGPASAAAYRALVEARFAYRSILEMKPDDLIGLAGSVAWFRWLVERELALWSSLSGIVGCSLRS